MASRTTPFDIQTIPGYPDSLQLYRIPASSFWQVRMNEPTNEQEQAVMEFITKFDASRDPNLWIKLVDEESNEVVEAFGHLMKELADLCYVACGACLTGTNDGDFEPTHAMLAAEKVMDYRGAFDTPEC